MLGVRNWNDKTGDDRKEIPLLNWNFIIQNSGTFHRELSVASIDNVLKGKRTFTIEYHRNQTTQSQINLLPQYPISNHNETLQIKGEIKVIIFILV